MNKTQISKIMKLKERLKHEEKSYKLLSANDDKIIMIMPNGSIAYILNKTELTGVSDINYSESPENIVNSFINDSTLEYKECKLNIGEIQELKNVIGNSNETNRNNPYKFKFNDIIYGFNCKYFFDVVVIMGKDYKFYVSNKATKPFMFKSDIGMALLMPVRVS